MRHVFSRSTHEGEGIAGLSSFSEEMARKKPLPETLFDLPPGEMSYIRGKLADHVVVGYHIVLLGFMVTCQGSTCLELP